MKFLAFVVTLVTALAAGPLTAVAHQSHSRARGRARGSQPVRWRKHRTGAASGEKHGRAIRTFSGSCSFSGIVHFHPALSNNPQTVRDVAAASGTCTGTLTTQSGHAYELSGTPVRYLASDVGSDDSCAVGPQSVGGGEFVFPQGRLRFRLTESRAASTADLLLTGALGGSAQGVADSTGNPVQTAQACAGAGLSQAPVDIRIETTPTISG